MKKKNCTVLILMHALLKTIVQIPWDCSRIVRGRVRLSKGLQFLVTSLPSEGYSANKFIAYGEEVYDDFSRQTRGPVNIA